MIRALGKIFRRLLTVRVWPKTISKALVSRAGLGTAILAMAGAIYLEPYITDTFSCLGNMIQAPTAGRSIEWKCMKDMLDDLRDDGTAATVILAIAAAVLASAWSSGSRSAE